MKAQKGLEDPEQSWLFLFADFKAFREEIR
jgi:hypothetical protein